MVQKQKPTEEQLARIEQIMNECPVAGAIIVAHCVPTRAFRVLMLKDQKTFRVEQIDTSSWSWKALSTHVGDEKWESFGAALQDAIDKQEQFKLRIRQEQLKQKQAALMAEAAHSMVTH